jgi:hypothetical protein
MAKLRVIRLVDTSHIDVMRDNNWIARVQLTPDEKRVLILSGSLDREEEEGALDLIIGRYPWVTVGEQTARESADQRRKEHDPKAFRRLKEHRQKAVYYLGIDLYDVYTHDNIFLFRAPMYLVARVLDLDDSQVERIECETISEEDEYRSQIHFRRNVSEMMRPHPKVVVVRVHSTVTRGLDGVVTRSFDGLTQIVTE